jgi:hypothetical protein
MSAPVPKGGPPVSQIEGDTPRLITVIDTEEEFDWTRPFDRGSTGITHLNRIGELQAVFDAQGVRPVYAVDFAIASQPAAVATLAGIADAGRALIGAHLHPWVTPPFVEEVSAHNSYPGNLPAALERDKLTVLADRIASAFGGRPTIYTAGRYGIGPNTFDILEDLGFTVDLSAMPSFDYRRDGGPDFSRRGQQPGWFGRTKQVLSIPNTSALVGYLPRRNLRMLSLAVMHRRLRTLRLPAVLSRLGLVERIALSPEGYTLNEMLRLTRSLFASGQRLFVLRLHSPSVAPGHTPYVHDEADRRALLSTIGRYIDFFRREMRGEMTDPLAELHHLAGRRATGDRDGLAWTVPGAGSVNVEIADHGTIADRGTAADHGTIADRGTIVDRGTTSDRGPLARIMTGSGCVGNDGQRGEEPKTVAPSGTPASDEAAASPEPVRRAARVTLALSPILDADLPEVAAYWNRNLNPGISCDLWIDAFRHGWMADKPNNGFLLRSGGRVVGALGAIYARRQIAGRALDFCNLTSLVVEPAHRAHVMDLLSACLSQKNLCFTNFTPTRSVEKMLRLLRFTALPSGEYLVPHLPVPAAAAGLTAIEGYAELGRRLTGAAAKLWRDHRSIPWLNRFAVGDDKRWCLVFWKPAVIKGVPAAQLLGVSDTELLHEWHQTIGGHLLLHHGVLASRIDALLLPKVNWPGIRRPAAPHLVRAPADLPTDQVSFLYSELAALPL